MAQLNHPGLSFSAKAARLCSTMPDGVTLPSQLDGNESDLWRCLEMLPKIMFCDFFNYICLYVKIDFIASALFIFITTAY